MVYVGPCTGNGDGAANLEDRLKGLEQNVSVLKSKSGEQKVDDAIRQVRLLAARRMFLSHHWRCWLMLQSVRGIRMQSFLIKLFRHAGVLKKVRMCVAYV